VGGENSNVKYDVVSVFEGVDRVKREEGIGLVFSYNAPGLLIDNIEIGRSVWVPFLVDSTEHIVVPRNCNTAVHDISLPY